MPGKPEPRKKIRCTIDGVTIALDADECDDKIGTLVLQTPEHFLYRVCSQSPQFVLEQVGPVKVEAMPAYSSSPTFASFNGGGPFHIDVLRHYRIHHLSNYVTLRQATSTATGARGRPRLRTDVANAISSATKPLPTTTTVKKQADEDDDDIPFAEKWKRLEQVSKTAAIVSQTMRVKSPKMLPLVVSAKPNPSTKLVQGEQPYHDSDSEEKGMPKVNTDQTSKKKKDQVKKESDTERKRSRSPLQGDLSSIQVPVTGQVNRLKQAVSRLDDDDSLRPPQSKFASAASDALSSLPKGSQKSMTLPVKAAVSTLKTATPVSAAKSTRPAPPMVPPLTPTRTPMLSGRKPVRSMDNDSDSD